MRIKQHLQLKITGQVQGIGFRPFVYRLAQKYQQNGWVANTDAGVLVALEGEAQQQQGFMHALQTELPLAQIDHIDSVTLPLAGFDCFQLKPSLTTDADKSAFVLPDIATCPACIQELFDPGSRFYHYPFLSCCHCGPRYSILRKQPYDRDNTSMAAFELCSECQADYENPADRRFHAQTLACPECGPRLSLHNPQGQHLATAATALEQAVQALKEGKILAVKSIGGFQLFADAHNPAVIARLRQRKQRPHKPFALMLPSLAAVEALCYMTPREQQALIATAAPIVLLRKRPAADTLLDVAADNPLLGVMLPYTPLHHLLTRHFADALIATSANRSNEPICISDTEAFERLHDIADVFLCHDRAVLRPLDDSIVRLIGTKITVLRRARGYVPTPIALPADTRPALAVGGHLKNTIAISHGNQAIVSQHLGDLDNLISQQQFQVTISDLQRFYHVNPQCIIHDAHPHYASSQYARSQPLPAQAMQHHHAHILSCMLEHGLKPPVLGLAWDGTGFGKDGRLWGGEFFSVDAQGFQRFAHLRHFPLVGGHKAIQEPRRAALGLLYAAFGEKLATKWRYPEFEPDTLQLLQTALQRHINSPETSSIGRLFDAIASLTGLCQINHYEGEAAIRLEAAACSYHCDKFYPYQLTQSQPIIIDWQPMLHAILDDIERDQIQQIAAKFHNTLIEIALAVAQLAGQRNIVISGGCFQNHYLVDRLVRRLHATGFAVFQQENIPPNDGGLALGQLAAARTIYRTI